MDFQSTGRASFYGDFLYDMIVPKDHFLRHLREAVPWQRYTYRLIKYYRGKGERGRPPVDPAEVLKLADQLMAKMVGAGVENGHGTSNGDGNGHTNNGDAAWCSIHDCAMDRYEKNGRSWYSHRSEGGKWCKGR